LGRIDIYRKLVHCEATFDDADLQWLPLV
jgi:hypothetical protein